MEISEDTFCSCGTPCMNPDDKLKCIECKKYFHLGCLGSDKPSSLAGDIFFDFTCRSCNDGTQKFVRMKLKWVHVIAITLYNLQLQDEPSKCGYYRWREQICSFVDKHWTTFFGNFRKKNQRWRGTVAGCLSSGCHQYFESGTPVLKEPGFWKLAKPRISELFSPDIVKSTPKPVSKRPRSSFDSKLSTIDCQMVNKRRRASNPFQAAIDLKEKKSLAQDTTRKGRNSSGSVVEENATKAPEFVIRLAMNNNSKASSSLDTSISETKSDFGVKQEPVDYDDNIPEIDPVEDFIKQEEESGDEIDLEVNCVEVNALNSKSECEIEDISNIVDTCISLPETLPATIQEEVKVKQEIKSEINIIQELENNVETGQSDSELRKLIDHAKMADCNRIQPLSVYDEYHLLVKLKDLQNVVDKNPEARRLQRKLLLRKTKHERNLEVFDLQNQITQIMSKKLEYSNLTPKNEDHIIGRNMRILDRFQTMSRAKNNSSHNSKSKNFITKLIGCNENNTQCIVSPYTGRILKPYIRRDYESMPLKLKLLNEIAEHHLQRNGISDHERRKNHPVDYCYVQPSHIPSINNLCREFFWPGIDLSECLQYPDFSCVVLYRKIVVGFAFMVPDVKCNEAYITFFFSHPEWRNAGIGKFMLYHLIQTCMGKDITLHVSARNPAMVLYQKFGFKVEELVLDFYDKYLPIDSRECRHAMFLRLSR